MLFQAGVIYAQEVPKAVVVYDPVFWSETLKLDHSQLEKIREINHTYYQTLMAAVETDRNDPKKLQMVVAKSLLLRSQSIWDTFYPKQKRKWKKMWGNDSAEHTIYKVASIPTFQKFRI
jgi:hypothetical protein